GALIARMESEPEALVATPAMQLRSEEVQALRREEEAGRVGGTTVVTDSRGHALYFSKRLIPHLPKWAAEAEPTPMKLHVGVYAYRPAALELYRDTPQSEWDMLDPKYRLILCDLWGVVHDGVELYPGATQRLHQWRDEGRCVILLTNAPRTEDAVERQLTEIGLPNDCWDAIATSGEAGIAALNALGRPVGFIGTPDDREVLEGRGVVIADDGNFADLACTGLRERPYGKAEDYRAELARLVERDVHMHCLNPDRVVVRGGV